MIIYDKISIIQANFIPIQMTKQNKLTENDKLIADQLMNAIVRLQSNRQAVYFIYLY